MNVSDAVYRTVHDYPGGASALAARLDMAAAVLNSRANPNVSTHTCSVQLASQLVGMTGDARILQALAAEHGYGLVPLDTTDVDEAGTMDVVLAEHSASGALASALQDALADGVITPRELAAVEQAGLAVQSAVVALVGHMSRAVRKPRVVA